MNEQEKFEKLKTSGENFVVLEGAKKILISAPHSVEQIRNGKIKYAEPETALIALHLNELGYPCFIKTKNENDDANFDSKSKYRDSLINYCLKNDIKFVLDLHQLSDKREMDFCLGTGGKTHKNLLENLKIIDIFKFYFEKENYVFKINDPFDADAPNTVSTNCAKNQIPSVLLEMNCRVVSKFCGGQNLQDVMKIIENILIEIEKEIYQMKLLLVTNVSLDSEKFNLQNQLLFDTAKKLNINLQIAKNTELLNFVGQENCFPKCDAVLFYDKDVFLARAFEKQGYKVFNCSDSIFACDNKAKTYEILNENNIKIPKTFLLPLMFNYKKEYVKNFVSDVIKNLKLPLVAKKFYGSEGKQVFLINSEDEMFELIEKEQGRELLFQKYYSECHGKDVRINVVGKEVVASMKRESKNGDFRSNLSNGGVAYNYQPTIKEIDLAKKVSKILGCDFCGVDILQTNEGPVVCEVNSNAHLKNIFDTTNVNVAEFILKYIKQKINKS